MNARLLVAATLAIAVPGYWLAASDHGPAHATPAPAAAPAAHAPAADPHAASPHATPSTQPAHAAGIPADVALKMLADGNEHFVSHKLGHPHQDQMRLCETFANGQHPFAAILSCADSRVPPELVFDAGIGDLFVVRVAGNVADVDEIGTLEYGVEHLGINLIVVMGHTKCGAVTAVVDHAHVTPNIGKLVSHIEPAAEVARKQFPQLSGGRLVEKAIKANVRHSIEDIIAKSDMLKERIASGKLKVVGGVYDLHTGAVDWHEQPIDAKPADGHAASKTGDLLKDHAPASAKDAHGAPAPHGAAPHGDAHGSQPHSKADSHGDAHATAGHSTPTTKPTDGHAKDEPRKENFLALGGLLGGGAVTSYAIIHFAMARKHA